LINTWKENIDSFLLLAEKFQVRMLMIGGGAVNFHGYQRHSADVDFWIENSKSNFRALIEVFQSMDYEIHDFPEDVKKGKKNISVKFSPKDLKLELITHLPIEKTFDSAYQNARKVSIEKGGSILKWRVLSYEDLIDSKIKSGRPKDFLDIQELERIRGEE